MCRLLHAVFMACACWLLASQGVAGPAADIMVASDVFTIGDDIEVWVTAVNPTHESEVDVYLAATADGGTMYLGLSGWTTENVPLFAGFLMPQFMAPVLQRLATIEAGGLVAPPNKKCTLKLWLTASNVREMVYCEDEASFSVAPQGFVAVPSGRFVMGTSDTPNWDARMVPHKVCLNSFFMGETETTISEFAGFLNAAGATLVEGRILGPEGEKWAYLEMPIEFEDGVFRPTPGYEDTPASVRRLGAEAYAVWMGARLPTEAQWEYAARAFAPGDYPWGDEESCDWGNIDVDGHPCSWDPLPVRSFPPNDFGLYEICGNSSEMCSDWFDLDLTQNASWGMTYYEWCLENYPDGIVNPQGPPGPPPGEEPTSYLPFRLIRGGPPTIHGACMLWVRNWVIDCQGFDGFRVVLEPPK
ncbi:MAG: SUMF1/EgtB/PvdO family nonheme iron enzyme [Candidatus Coatesbacteria bacterium]|nr:SUMF1/EgtB/PvdO family nonheme iron enzyme [Candidatus Coatesbacteria bacterium]